MDFNKNEKIKIFLSVVNVTKKKRKYFILTHAAHLTNFNKRKK